MAKLIFEGLTMAQAKMLGEWYGGQGESDADVWFECNGEDRAPNTRGMSVIDKEKQTVTYQCE